ncbi:putative dihydropteroate synthase [Selenomonas ruminantium subsp. lactilytica TAM6421]|uniref:Dihydropteroate synthase n=1 Tax=Selenomonas ruminantium subsp. lactilytica (strain NBRC 103574 / TAM6421) TaxID=927704 RepID=I0GUJ8_SELRL|nr:dihydropteroate synthase [Selenomonas ruminantium]BAL84435.1 putative dihydropteroate synthase [Selenomonas ruminantium subsp. lactilytica TAM6421]
MTVARNYTFADGKTLTLGERTLVMGILNVTPDSFSDGGQFNTVDKALRHLEEMVADGADIIDVGAESSRPGFVTMPASEEIERLMPFLEAVLKNSPVPVSVDTFKAETAREAAKAGAHILNDIWGLQYEKEPGAMAKVAAECGLPVIVMHNQNGTEYSGDIIESMQAFFRESLRIGREAGMKDEQFIFDPGIGFGKTAEQNVEVLRRQEELLTVAGQEYPLLLANSRKSFIGKTLDLPVDERMEATGASCVIGIMKGASIVRVHDVKPIVRMCRMTDVILRSGENG